MRLVISAIVAAFSTALDVSAFVCLAFIFLRFAKSPPSRPLYFFSILSALLGRLSLVVRLVISAVAVNFRFFSNSSSRPLYSVNISSPLFGRLSTSFRLVISAVIASLLSALALSLLVCLFFIFLRFAKSNPSRPLYFSSIILSALLGRLSTLTRLVISSISAIEALTSSLSEHCSSTLTLECISSVILVLALSSSPMRPLLFCSFLIDERLLKRQRFTTTVFCFSSSPF